MLVRPASLYPLPRCLEWREGAYALAGTLALEAPRGWREGLAPELTALGLALQPLPMGATRMAIRQGTVADSDQAYHLAVTRDGIALTAPTLAGARYGLRTLGKLISGGEVPCCEVTDWPTLPYRGVQIDIARVIERPEVIERLLPIYASLGYNVLQLYLENAFLFPSHPKLARPHAWTLEQAMRVTEAAGRYGIGVIPAIQALGHSHWVSGHPDYAELDELHESGAASGVLCPSHPRTQAMLDDMIRDVAPLATAGIIHLGMDESPCIGRCRCCTPLREEIGEGGIFVKHANAVAAMVKAAGKRPGIWGDMFYYYPEDVARLDKDVLVFDWYYFTFDTVPGVQLYEHAPMDTAAMYRAHGIDSWGCPSSLYTATMPYCLPQESITNARDWTRYGLSSGSQGVMVTQWELALSTIDVCVPIEAAAAGFLWGDGLQTPASDLLREACACLYDRPELAPLLEEIGRARFYDYGTRRWHNAPTLAQMITYQQSAPDLALAARMEEIAETVSKLAERSKRPEMVQAFIPAARWLAYQYRKRARLNEAALAACAGQYPEAQAALQELREAALALADCYQEEWNRNRYADDPAAIPARLHEEAAIFEAELSALGAAMNGQPYHGQLTTPVLAVQVVDSFGTTANIGISISADGETFTEQDTVWVLRFDSKTDGQYATPETLYTFPVDSLAAARFMRITAGGPGHYGVSGITLHQGTTTWTAQSVTSEGKVENADALLSGGLATLGHPDPKALYRELLASGDSSRIFTIVHGHLTAEMGG